MGVSDTVFCDYCLNTVDVIEHFFFECPSVKRFWKHIESTIFIATGNQMQLSVTDVLFGYNKGNLNNTNQWINKNILVGKMCISKIKKTKSLQQYEIIFEQEARLRNLLHCQLTGLNE